MISFITISKNQSIYLEKCLKSIIKFIIDNKINSYEIIYVDSESNENNIEIALAYNVSKVMLVKGQVNAAIARNVGAKIAIGEYLFFIDGDMEIIPAFYSEVFTDNGYLKYNFVSGQFINIYYDKKGRILYTDENIKKNINKDTKETTVGGLFLIKKKLWQSVGGMKEKYKRSHDLDLGLRLSKTGNLLIRKGKIAAVHHTVMYQSSDRMWDMFKEKKIFYQSSVLYKDHILNIYIYKFIIRKDYTLIIFILSILLSFFLSKYFFLLYVSILILRSILNTIKTKINIFRITYFNLLKDLGTFVFLFTFFPKIPNYTIKTIK